MEWPYIVVLVLAIPVIILPVLVIWYINAGGIFAILNQHRKKAAAKWLFDFERKGSIAWDRQDSVIHQQYIRQVDHLIEQIKK